jgi:hypothetical protein
LAAKFIFESQHEHDKFDLNSEVEYDEKFPLAARAERFMLEHDEQYLGVISLNYDTILERAGLWRRPSARGECNGEHAQNNPIRIPSQWSSGVASGTPLLKLHGSTHWFINQAGEEIVDVGFSSHGCTLSASDGDWWEHQKVHAPGLRRLIVPPVAAKSAYFEYPVLRTLWKIAAELMRQAKEIVIIGYSLPPEDTMLHRLLQEATTDTKFIVVNLDPTGPQAQLAKLGFTDIRSFKGLNCISDYLDSESA